jgi:hypothetical protein
VYAARKLRAVEDRQVMHSQFGGERLGGREIHTSGISAIVYPRAIDYAVEYVGPVRAAIALDAAEHRMARQI